MCQLAGDKAHKRRTAVVSATAKRVEDGSPAFGLRKLCELLGSKVAKAAVEWMGADTFDWSTVAVDRAADPQKSGLILHAGNEYRIDSTGTWLIAPRDDGEEDKRLVANFSAKITEDVTVDDGMRQERRFRIAAALVDGEITCEVPATEFGRMYWVHRELAARGKSVLFQWG